MGTRPTEYVSPRYWRLIWSMPVEFLFGQPLGVHSRFRGTAIFIYHERHNVVGELAATFVHELLHAAHPKKSRDEEWIERKMHMLFRNHRFMRQVFARLCHCMLRELRTLTPERCDERDKRETPVI